MTVFKFSEEALEIKARVGDFMQQHIYPANAHYLEIEKSPQRNDPDALAFIDDLRAMAKEQGLWNMFFPHLREDEPGVGLSNVDYAPILEEMATITWAPEVFNCQGPNSGNVELLHAAGTEEQRQKWMRPVLEGDWQTCFCATEPEVASSDPTNYQTNIVRDGDEYVLNGRKWMSSRALHPNCQYMVVVVKSNPDNPKPHQQMSVIMVPRNSPGIEVIQDFSILNAHHIGGHPEIVFNNVRVPVENLIGEEGDGFAVMQSRMGPGRIHYGMRCIGLAEAALGMMVSRSKKRFAFGKYLHEHGSVANDIGRSRIEIDQARLFCLNAASKLDELGARGARKEIAMLKIIGAELVQSVSQRAIRVHGAMGLTEQTPLAEYLSLGIVMSIADGPSEVHLPTIARMELRANDPEDFELFYDVRGRN